MKKILAALVFLLLIISSIYIFYSKYFRKENITILPTPGNMVTDSISFTPEPSSVYKPSGIISSNNYNVEYIIVRDLKKLFLYSNAEEKLTSTEAVKKYGCDKLISGGFWREDNGEPIGLLISEGKVLNNKTAISFYNGFFYIDYRGNFNISEKQPELSDMRIAIQSGPLLFDRNLPLSLKVDNDDKSRRIVVAKTRKGEIVFLVIYYKPSTLVGPKLKDLSILLDELYKNTNLKIESALNLDGGSHSSFISDSVSLTEISRIGSFFCIKP